MFYIGLFYASVSKMCPNETEKPKRTGKGVRLSTKLDVIKWFFTPSFIET